MQSNLHASEVVEVVRRQQKQLQLEESLAADCALFEVLSEGCLQRRVAADETLSHIVVDRWLVWRGAFNDGYLCIQRDESVDEMVNERCARTFRIASRLLQKTNAFADDVRYVSKQRVAS